MLFIREVTENRLTGFSLQHLSFISMVFANIDCQFNDFKAVMRFVIKAKVNR